MTDLSTRDPRDRQVPLLSLLFGYGPMLPIVAAAATVWLAPQPWPLIATSLGILWAGAILLFLSGVRRGLAFVIPGGGERPAQMATMLWLFVLALGAFVAPTPIVSLALLLLGYISVGVLDPIAARRNEAPAHFARLRPPQMMIGAAGLATLLVYQLARGPGAMVVTG
jgi:hypothetical protein